MKKTILFFISLFIAVCISAQDLSVKKYTHTEGYNILPNLVLERDDDIVIPFYVAKNEEKKSGLLYLNKDMTVDDAILFDGSGTYVINDIKQAESGNLFVSAEGYSDEGQESIYFLELDNKQVVNDFIFNEDGNEVDPFAVVEIQDEPILAGFIKSRKLIGNSFYNMYSEDQMIYIGRFKKNGTKLWAKAINLEGYDQGICNKIVALNDYLFLLCHANKDGNLYPFIIKMNKKGDVIQINRLFNRNEKIQISDLVLNGEQLVFSGTYNDGDGYHYYSAILSQELNISEITSYSLPNNIIIESSEFYNNAYHLYGTIMNQEESYNYLYMKQEGLNIQLYQAGGRHIDYLIGRYNDNFIGYSASNKNSRLDVVILNRDLLSSVNLVQNNLFKIENDIFSSYEIIKDFQKSSINRGCEKITVKNIKNNIK